jgi:hypothetical protein
MASRADDSMIGLSPSAAESRLCAAARTGHL